MTRRQKLRFKTLRDSTLKTARAWAVKEFAMSLSRHGQGEDWERWLSWTVCSGLEPIKKVWEQSRIICGEY
uniref:hypothetical protein n=1 Tax=Candidatus Vondammii sp. HM_W22 TaxID=2687299 RepID=UPI002E7C4EC5|nr:hypothetical protein [Candidatus Vondammii sp. HM_W22]